MVVGPNHCGGTSLPITPVNFLPTNQRVYLRVHLFHCFILLTECLYNTFSTSNLSISGWGITHPPRLLAENNMVKYDAPLCCSLANRLVKHTGYGNAAGLLMCRGMLGGRMQPRELEYSEDEDSDTEEYLKSR